MQRFLAQVKCGCGQIDQKYRLYASRTEIVYDRYKHTPVWCVNHAMGIRWPAQTHAKKHTHSRHTHTLRLFHNRISIAKHITHICHLFPAPTNQKTNTKNTKTARTRIAQKLRRPSSRQQRQHRMCTQPSSRRRAASRTRTTRAAAKPAALPEMGPTVRPADAAEVKTAALVVALAFRITFWKMRLSLEWDRRVKVSREYAPHTSAHLYSTHLVLALLIV